jgi:hypoxanthine-guanine phosphoribosyltransferase
MAYRFTSQVKKMGTDISRHFSEKDPLQNEIMFGDIWFVMFHTSLDYIFISWKYKYIFDTHYQEHISDQVLINL